MKAAIVYVCQCCGAVCTQLVWAALGLDCADGRCPGCGQWAKFKGEPAKDLEKAA